MLFIINASIIVQWYEEMGAERAHPTCRLLYIAVDFSDYVFVIAVVAVVFGSFVPWLRSPPIRSTS